ncbi:acetyl-CoA carboxylase biotin carboxyl carrier protein [Kineococcus sp. SYSU DK005]|uniref:acetyl-CoA carboxylase biotin carboxyl carrier protein n=1 Tax=Kineococcus sp. SYSU DK005 TaxID=3383126 RepID=UPI003D7D4030
MTTNGTSTTKGSNGTGAIGAGGVGGAVEVHHDTVEVHHDVVQELTDQAVSLSRSLHGPLKRIALSRGEVTVEVDWQDAVSAAPAAVHPVGVPAAAAPAAPAAAAGAAVEEDLHTVRAPLVGTFYAAPSPDEAPYVSPGETVTVGQTLGIVEAMKLMNSIVSDVAGTVVEVLVENGSSVEFDQPLVRIEPADAHQAG